MVNTRLNEFGGLQKFHLVGIGGSGMSGLAELLAADGFAVSGSDLRESRCTERLRGLGVRVHIGHGAANVSDACALVISSAVAADNPEIEAARQRGTPILHRATLLAELMRFRVGIAVAGSHGKTTTTAMLGAILRAAGEDPTVYAGANLPGQASGALRGRGRHFVAEADESDRSFLKLRPVHAVVTNLDLDHVDQYRDLADLTRTFQDFISGLPFYGNIVTGADDPSLAEVVKNVHPRVLTCAVGLDADYQATECRVTAQGSEYRLKALGVSGPMMRLRVPGEHNLRNSLAAAAAGHMLGVDLEVIADALADFAGAERRLEVKGERQGVLVIDDYAHHPAEISASLAACRGMGRRMVVVYQPHRYTRTRAFLESLAEALAESDRLFIVDVYGAGESPIPGADGKTLAKRAAGRVPCTYAESRERLLDQLVELLRPGDLLVTMGAGDIGELGEQYLAS